MKARSHKPGSACKYLNDKVVINKDNNYFFKIFILFIFKYFTYLFFREGKGERREGEKNPCVVASCVPPTGDLARNPAMCPRLGTKGLPVQFPVRAKSPVGGMREATTH